MKNKTEIRYWLKKDGEEIDILATESSKVPEVGEVINFGHRWDEERANHVYEHLNDNQKKIFYPKLEKLLDGDYVVTKVKRWISSDYHRTKLSSIIEGCSVFFTGGTSTSDIFVPQETITEVFEVFIEPFRHTELTETPIAKVRNLLSPILTSFQLVELIKQNPGREQEIIELLVGGLDIANENIKKLLEIVKDDKNWK